MLTRRHLRIKVFQALYALESARDADYRLAEDFISDSFQPDLNSMQAQDLRKLEGYRKIASSLLQENYLSGKIEDDDAPAQALVAARNALKLYQKEFRDDQQRIGRQLTPDVDGIYNYYVSILQLLAELTHISAADRERTYDDEDFPIAREAGLDSNCFFKQFPKNTVLEVETIRRNINWNEDLNTVRKIYKEVFKSDEIYKAYCAQKKHTAEEDQALAQHVLKQIVFKNTELVEYFERKDLFWAENSEIVRKMLVKTLKQMGETGKLDLVPLTDAWDEDQFFMQELFRHTIENSLEYEKVIAEPLKNWEIDRLALTDNIILKMGVAEMINFPNIPLKVTINEYIDISKEYSTPKSNKFVNGMMDSLSKQLQKENKIRKSGRGLMDNK